MSQPIKPVSPAAPGGVAGLERHPRDGWVRADPWPMSPGLQRALHGLVKALCPPADVGAPTDDAVLAEVTTHVRLFLPYMNWLAAQGVVFVVRALDWSPLWRLRGLKRLHRLPTDVASAQLDDLAASPLFGKLVLAARATILTAYFDQPVVHAALGYEPVPFMRERLEARRQLLADRNAAAPTLEPSEAEILRWSKPRSQAEESTKETSSGVDAATPADREAQR